MGITQLFPGARRAGRLSVLHGYTAKRPPPHTGRHCSRLRDSCTAHRPRNREARARRNKRRRHRVTSPGEGCRRTWSKPRERQLTLITMDVAMRRRAKDSATATRGATATCKAVAVSLAKSPKLARIRREVGPLSAATRWSHPRRLRTALAAASRASARYQSG